MVLYIVCFDLAAPPDEQRRQIESWLSYLNSLLCHNNSIRLSNQKDGSVSEWKIIIAGTRSDQKHPQTTLLQSTSPFQQKFLSLPLHDTMFYFSTFHDPKSVKVIFKEIVQQCKLIMDHHSKLLPTFYTTVKNNISASSSSSNYIIDMLSILPKSKENVELTNQALQHLHAIGEIVMFGKDKVCTNPEVISKLMAKFISPAEVRTKLLWEDHKCVSLLKKHDMQMILQVKDSR